MSDRSPPQKRGTSMAITAMVWFLPLADVAIEVVDEVNSSTPTALIAARVLVRVGALFCTSNRTG